MKISENQKVTLTLGQLKRLVKESRVIDNNKNIMDLDDSELTIMLKGTEGHPDGWGYMSKFFDSVDSALEFCDEEHNDRDSIKSVLVHKGDKTLEYDNFWGGRIMGTTNDWEEVKEIITKLVDDISKA